MIPRPGDIVCSYKNSYAWIYSNVRNGIRAGGNLGCRQTALVVATEHDDDDNSYTWCFILTSSSVAGWASANSLCVVNDT